MAQVRGFPPISQPDARVLILGSMPSRESLARGQYYAHPRNAFWPIVCDLLDIGDSPYEERIARLTARGMAVWDVLKACFREGSLDSAIDEGSAEVNDFRGFYARHPQIRRVFFNGAKAESLYRKQVLPTLSASASAIPLRRLPSTSPGHASMTFEQKKAAWRVLVLASLK